jgi:hypothetical protein
VRGGSGTTFHDTVHHPVALCVYRTKPLASQLNISQGSGHAEAVGARTHCFAIQQVAVVDLVVPARCSPVPLLSVRQGLRGDVGRVQGRRRRRQRAKREK